MASAFDTTLLRLLIYSLTVESHLGPAGPLDFCSKWMPSESRDGESVILFVSSYTLEPAIITYTLAYS